MFSITMVLMQIMGTVGTLPRGSPEFVLVIPLLEMVYLPMVTQSFVGFFIPRQL